MDVVVNRGLVAIDRSGVVYFVVARNIAELDRRLPRIMLNEELIGLADVQVIEDILPDPSVRDAFPVRAIVPIDVVLPEDVVVALHVRNAVLADAAGAGEGLPRGVKLTRQCPAGIIESHKLVQGEDGRDAYILRGKVNCVGTGTLMDNSAVMTGYVSITPLSIDLTDADGFAINSLYHFDNLIPEKRGKAEEK